jgi:hypothetical protein
VECAFKVCGEYTWGDKLGDKLGDRYEKRGFGMVKECKERVERSEE